MTQEKRNFIIFLWCIVIFIFLYNFWLPYVVKILYLGKYSPGAAYSNFLIYYNAGNLFKSNNSPYFINGKTTWFFYPPTFLPLYKIISDIPMKLSAHIWGILGILIFLGVASIICKNKLMLLSLCVLSKPMVYNFMHGQVELVSVSFILLSFLCYTKMKSPWKLIGASAFLAIGFHWKITPILFLVFYLLKKEWKILIWTIIFVFIIMIISYLYIPQKIFFEYYLQVLPYLSKEIRGFPNQGIIFLFKKIGLPDLYTTIMLIIYGIGFLLYLWRKRLKNDILLFTIVILFIIQLPPIAWPPIYTWTIVPSVFIFDFILKEIIERKIAYRIIIGITLMYMGVVNLPILQQINLFGNLITLFYLIQTGKK